MQAKACVLYFLLLKRGQLSQGPIDVEGVAVCFGRCDAATQHDSWCKIVLEEEVQSISDAGTSCKCLCLSERRE